MILIVYLRISWVILYSIKFHCHDNGAYKFTSSVFQPSYHSCCHVFWHNVSLWLPSNVCCWRPVWLDGTRQEVSAFLQLNLSQYLEHPQNRYLIRFATRYGFITIEGQFNFQYDTSCMTTFSQYHS